MSEKNCKIKVILNPTLPRGFSLEFTGLNLYIRILLQSPNDFESVVDDIREKIILRTGYQVQFNWKNTPDSISGNKKCIGKLLRFFSVNRTEKKIRLFDAKVRAEIVRRHIDNFGMNPDPKNREKFENYIKSVLGIPKMSEKDLKTVIEILDLTKSESQKS